VLAACGNGKPKIAGDLPDGATHSDAGDASTDGGTTDGGAVPGDAAVHRDGSTPAADGGDEDGGTKPGEPDPTHACDVAADNSELALPFGPRSDDSFSLAIGVTGFGVAYQAPGCNALGAMPVAAEGAFLQPNTLLDDCFTKQDVTLLRVTDGWRMAFVDNSSPDNAGAEVQTVLLSDTLSMSDSAPLTRITMNTLREHKPVFANVAGVPHLAWISEDMSTGKRQIDRKRFDDQGGVTSVIGADSGRKPVSLAFAQMSKATAAIAFVDEQGMPGIWLQALDKTVQPVGEPVLVSDAITAGNSVDLATREEDGGAIVYSVDIAGVNHEIRFRRLDNHGGLLGDESKVVGSPLQGRDASIARLGGGYVVGYRQLPTKNTPMTEIRLLFITKEGNVMTDSVGRLQTYLVAETALTSGPVTLRVSTDGQVLVAFLDTSSAGNQLRLVRKRLDCGL
jgi:hypothetical protein